MKILDLKSIADLNISGGERCSCYVGRGQERRLKAIFEADSHEQCRYKCKKEHNGEHSEFGGGIKKRRKNLAIQDSFVPIDEQYTPDYSYQLQ